MELRYLLARSNGKRLIFIVSPKEESLLRERLEGAEDACRILWGREWGDGAKALRKLGRWIGKVHTWVISSEHLESDALTEIICQAHVSGGLLRDFDSYLAEVDQTVPASSESLIRFLCKNAIHQDRGLRLYSAMKYVLEPFAALLLLAVAAPIMALVALAVKLSSPGPVIYQQERTGYRGKTFRIYKFRSMRVDAEKNGPAWASASKTDPQLTPIGGFLRASHLDELPQLWNILCGDLSFIGPRPERPEFVQQLTKSFPLFRLRPLIKPGITGWAQVGQGYANSFADSLRKLEFDLFYLAKHSPRLDALIVFKTIRVLLTGGTEKIKRARSKIKDVPVSQAISNLPPIPQSYGGVDPVSSTHLSKDEMKVLA